MTGMKTLMLGVALAAGAAGLGATSAQAAEFRLVVRGPVAYVPPCPGPGYFWIAGYNDGGYWVPGRWEFRGPVVRDRFYGHDFDRDRAFDRARAFGRDRGFDRDHQRDDFRR